MKQHAILTYKEAAEYLRLHETTLRRLVSQGKIAPSQISPRRVAFLRTELDRYVQESMQPRAA